MSISLTLLLILANVAIFFYSANRSSFVSRFILNPSVMKRPDSYYRFLTSGFLHADLQHLFFNMLTLYFFGEFVEAIFRVMLGPDMGMLAFLALYLLGIVVSDVPSFLKHRNDYQYRSLGASGGVSAVVFASILFAPLNKICLYFFICLPGFILGAIYLMYSYYASRRGLGYVNHSAHMYGALFGILFSLALEPAVLLHFFTQIAGWRIF